MTPDNFVLGSLDSLWYYGLPTSSSAPLSLPSRDLFASARPIATASLQSLFSAMDRDCDGRLSVHEMRSLLACTLGISSLDVSSLIESSSILTPNSPTSSSTHVDPSFDFPQFAQLYASSFTASQVVPKQRPTHKDANDGFDDELRDIFQIYDANHDGVISAAELAAVLLDMGLLPAHCSMDAHLRTCQAYIDSADLDSNGVVDLEEFKSMMMFHHSPTSDIQV